MTAAVSARSTCGPSATRGTPASVRLARSSGRPSRPRVRPAPTGARGSAALAGAVGQRDALAAQQVGEVGDLRHHRQPRDGGTAARRRARPTASRLAAFAAFVVVPPHHGAGGPERDDAIDAELGELLHDQLGLGPLHQREADGDRRGSPARLARSAPVGSTVGPEPSRSPAAARRRRARAGRRCAAAAPARGGGGRRAAGPVRRGRRRARRARDGRRGDRPSCSAERGADARQEAGVGGRDVVAPLLGELPQQLLLLRR